MKRKLRPELVQKLRTEIKRLKKKLVVEDDELCHIIARRDYEIGQIREALETARDTLVVARANLRKQDVKQLCNDAIVKAHQLLAGGA